MLKFISGLDSTFSIDLYLALLHQSKSQSQLLIIVIEWLGVPDSFVAPGKGEH